MVNRKVKTGFTLIELSIVIAIAAILLSSATVFFGNRTVAEKNRKTREKMETIAEAIKAYAHMPAHGLPCPASITAGLTDQWLGVGGYVCAKATPLGGPFPQVVMGAVPFLALGLPPEYMFDEWGNRIDYIMNKSMIPGTSNSWNTPPGITPHIGIKLPNGNSALTRSPSNGRGATIQTPTEIGFSQFSCIDNSRVPPTPPAMIDYSTQIPVCAAFVLISHGANGYMAYNSRGQQIPPPVAISSNPNEVGNTFAGTIIGTGAYPAKDNIFVTSQPNLDAGHPTTYFDDILVYRTKENIVSP